MKCKEFLNMKNGYTLEILPEYAGDDKESGLIEVPMGSDAYIHVITGTGNKYFYKFGEWPKNWKSDEWNGICKKYDSVNAFIADGDVVLWQRHAQPEELPFVDDDKKHSHYFIDVSDVDEIDFYQIALRYKVTDPCVQHILKKCLAVGGRGHKDFLTDLRDIADTAKRALEINNAT